MDLKVLDRAKLETWREVDGESWRAIAVDLIDIFIQTAPPLVNRISSRPAAINMVDIRDAAHALKSSCGTIGLDAVAAICERLEACAREESPISMPDDVSLLVAEFPNAIKEVEKYREELQAA